MLRAAGAKRRRAAAMLAVVAGVAGCGGDDYANDPGAPPAISVGAVVTVKGVTVSPARFDAGTVELLATNQTATSQRVLLRTIHLTGAGSPLAQSTGPINPGGTASLKAGLAAGTYAVSASSSRIAPATVVVVAARAGGADRLVQP